MRCFAPGRLPLLLSGDNLRFMRKECVGRVPYQDPPKMENVNLRAG